MMRHNANIHFDMDGVIANTEPLHVAAEQLTCIDYGFAVNVDEWQGFKGRTAQAIFKHLIDAYGDPAKHCVDALISHKTDYFLDLAKTGLAPIDGALEFVAWAKEAYDSLSLVTSSNQRVQECVIGRLGLEGAFDHIVTGDDIINGKPHPEPYLRAMQLSGATPENSTVIEDSTSGIQSALAAGCRVLAIATSHTVAELSSLSPTWVAKDYEEALSCLNRRG
jgi:beta-phosphoglucomutase